ncbi:MAG: MFS transporter [Candidatus Hodarchaeales archaeon]
MLPHRNIITLVFSHFLWGFVNFTYMIQIQPYLLTLYGTSSESAEIIGIILTIGSFSAVLPFLFSFIAEKYGRSRFIILGQVVSLFGLLSISFFVNSVLFAVLGIILFNVGLGIYESPLQGLIFESVTARRGMVYSLIYNSASISGILASLIVQNSGNQGIIPLFQFGCLLVLISTSLNLLNLRDVYPQKDEVQFPLRKLLSNPLAKLIAMIFFIDSILWGLPMSIENSVVIILFGVESEFIGLLLFVQTSIMVILQYPAGFLVDKFGKIFGLIVGELTGMTWILFFYLAILSPGDYFSLLVQAHIFLGISVAFWRPSLTLSFVTIDSESATTNFGMLSFVQRIGWVPTAALGGFLFANFGYELILFITFFGTIFLVFLFYKASLLEKKNHKDILIQHETPLQE